MKPLNLLFAALLVVLLASPAFGEVIWVVGTDNTLVSLNHTAPGVPLSSVAISGLGSGESIVGIDFRPASGSLVALTSGSRLYNVNTTTGIATPIGLSAFTPVLTGTDLGVDFNPTVDRIRTVSTSRQNLRLHPDLGTVAGTDTTLTYAVGDRYFGITPIIAGAAYTNSVPTAKTTTLYAIDSGRNALVRIGSIDASPSSPNTGLLFTVGSLGVFTGSSVGFDVSSATGVAFAALQVGGASVLYTIDLSTGAATALGTIGGVATVRGMAVGQNSIIYTVPVVGSATGQNGTSFRTDLILTNNSALPAILTIDFYRSSSSANAGVTNTLSITLGPGEQTIYRDIVRTQFNLDPGTGALRITASRPIAVRANIYNDQRSVGRGTFGQLIRAYTESERLTEGFLPGLSNVPATTGAGSRTNIGFFNPGTIDSTVTLTARSAFGTTLGTATRVVPAMAHQQFGLSEIFPSLASMDDIYVSYTATSSLFVYASVVDNTSGDGLYVRSDDSN